MCDEINMPSQGISRRQLGGLGVVAALAACTSSKTSASASGLVEAMVEVPAGDGVAEAFFVHPREGRHPGVVLWPDIAGLRDAKKAMARQLAARGFAVLAVNHYYRSSRLPVTQSFAEFMAPEGRARIMPMVAALTRDAVLRDAGAYADWLGGRAEVDQTRGQGVQGYCLTGPVAIVSPTADPRIRAAASFHGVSLANDKPDSAHLTLASTSAGYLAAIARNDDARDPAEKEKFRAAAQAAGRPAEVEVYPADHGWCVPDSPAYDAVQAMRALERLVALYSGL